MAPDRWRVMAALVAVCIAAMSVSGCAMYQGPRPGSTAAPPANPARPEPLPSVEYQHEVQPDESAGPGMPTGDTAAFSAAYAKRGQPRVAVAFYDAKHSVVMNQPGVPVLRAERSITGEAVVNNPKEKKDSTVHLQANETVTVFEGTGPAPSGHQLFSWSDIQQEVFQVLQQNGVQIVDPEMVTLTGIDKFVGRAGQGVSLHTAELESLRASADFEVLFLIQEVREGKDVILQGRAWDLRGKTLLGATRGRLPFSTESDTGKLLVKSRARRLTNDLLMQAGTAWSRS